MGRRPVSDRLSNGSGTNERNPSPTRRNLALFLVVAAAFYRSATFWALNAWDLYSPAKILLIAAAVASVGSAVLLTLMRKGFSPLPTGLAVAGSILLIMHWHQVGDLAGLGISILIVVLWWLGRRSDESTLLDGLALAVAMAVGLVPTIQLVAAHVQDAQPYPLAELRTPAPSQPSGRVEDVVVVIVDTYPSLMLRRSWFGGRPEELVTKLDKEGFSVPSAAWARHTYTALSVPSILELRSVVEPGPTAPWGNRSSNYSILRGDNFVSSTLRSAGFRSAHIESGWDGSTCGPNVDRCIQSPWIDEPVWQLLTRSVAHGWLQSRLHTITGTLNASDRLVDEMSASVGNGTHDYIFAHFLLPHDPYVVDEYCRPAVESPEGEGPASRRSAFRAQMSCVDRLLTTVVDQVGPRTAMLLTGDHGSNTGLQVGKSPDEWTDADVAERFGVFLAYKLPTGCSTDGVTDPMVAMGAILGCAVGQEFELPSPQYLIGAADPVPVDPERMARIQTAVENGLLAPEA